jgi:hypothetical protein
MNLRKCIVKNKQAYFHRWAEISKIVTPSMLAGRHNGGVIKQTVGIIEYVVDGTVHECYPNEIRFTESEGK